MSVLFLSWFGSAMCSVLFNACSYSNSYFNFNLRDYLLNFDSALLFSSRFNFEFTTNYLLQCVHLCVYLKNDFSSIDILNIAVMKIKMPKLVLQSKIIWLHKLSYANKVYLMMIYLMAIAIVDHHITYHANK